MLALLLSACVDDSVPRDAPDPGGAGAPDTARTVDPMGSLVEGEVGGQRIEIGGGAIAQVSENGGRETIGVTIAGPGFTCGEPVRPGTHAFVVYVVTDDGPVETDTAYGDDNAYIEAYLRDYDGTCDANQPAEGGGDGTAVTFTDRTDDAVWGTFSVDLATPGGDEGTVTGDFEATICTASPECTAD